jgi:hypothetical protein
LEKERKHSDSEKILGVLLYREYTAVKPGEAWTRTTKAYFHPHLPWRMAWETP